MPRTAFFGLHPAMADLLPLWTGGQGGSGPRHRAAGGQPVALRRDGGDGGRRPRLQRARRLAEPAGERHPGHLAAAGVQRRHQHHPHLAGRARGRRCPPAGSATSSCRAATRTAAARSRCRSCGTARSRRWAAACGPRSRRSSAFGPAQAAADNRATYPGTGLGASLATAAQIIRGDVGVEVITVDQGDWDMHTDMGSVGRRLDVATTPRTSRPRSRRSSPTSAPWRARSPW